MMNLSGKKVTVIGLGKSGLAACRLLLTQGAEVFVSEAKDDPSLRRLAESLVRSGVAVELGRWWGSGR
mgnify:CR=1 FL=1